ncbi:hypothetical protein [Dokdonella sp.]|uniref:hypothetical protein n=1 Tax=Dokdonella sp. TaxID=2291710 RepID=UPI0031C6079F|nr:hypothetical protein [Dokdonella sp.]
MKETILIKQCPAIQLAHLYEHLFCSEVDKLFYENGLFPYVDYFLSANTHQTGIIYIKLETYTDLAKEFSTNVENIKLSFSDEALSVAASQLIAENEFAYTGSGIEDIKKHLKSLDAITWQDIDSITSINTKGIKRQSTPFYIDTRYPLPAKKLFLTMAVDERAHEDIMQMLPLLRLVSFLISDTYETILSDKYGLYSLDGEFKNSNKLTSYQSVFNVPNGHLIDKKEVLKTVIEIIEYISLNNGFVRFVEELKDISYKSSSKVSPNALHGLTDTGILMGSEGWKELSSMTNIDTILKSLTLTVRTGSDKVSQKLTLSR